MNLFSNGCKALLQFFCLLAMIFCFSVSVDAQNVGSTGSPFLDGEAEKVCYSIGGVDVTLNKVSILGDGQTSALIQDTRYFTPANLEVFPDTTNGTLTFGICGGVDVTSDSIEYYIKEVKLCDDDVTNPNRYQPFLRNYLRAINKTTDSITTLGFYDFDYFGAPYTPSGSIGEGVCAGVDSTSYVDYEYLKECMIDSVNLTTQVEFIRLYIMQDSNRSYLDVNDEFEPYTLLGVVQKKCGDNEVLAIERLCDVVKREMEFSLAAEYSGDNTITYVKNSSVLDGIAITNYTVDCGQGERITDRQFIGCSCSYKNVPDGTYYLTGSFDLTNGGTATNILDTYTVRDGRLYQDNGSALVNGTWNIGTPRFIDINFTTEPFFRKFFKDGTTSDIKLDGSPHTLTGTPEENCLNDGLYYTQSYEPSTRPNQSIIGDECWEKVISSGGNTWEITGTFLDVSGASYNGVGNLADLKFNGVTLPLNYQYNISGLFEEDDFITDLQNYMIANNISFGSVSFDNGIITINALDPTVTSVTSTDAGINSTSAVYTGDTTLLFSVNRFADNGKEAITINHYGNETRLPGDAKRVACGGGSGNDEDGCDDLQRIVRNYQFTDTLVTFPANTIFSYAVTPAFGNPQVKTGGDPVVNFSTFYSNNANLPKCYKIASEITIDTRNGSSVFVIWIE